MFTTTTRPSHSTTLAYGALDPASIVAFAEQPGASIERIRDALDLDYTPRRCRDRVTAGVVLEDVATRAMDLPLRRELKSARDLLGRLARSGAYLPI